MAKVPKQIQDFFFLPASPFPLAVIRIGLAVLLLVQAILCSSLFFEWYSTQGILQSHIGEQFGAWGVPQTTQIVQLTSHWGFSERTTLFALAAVYLISLLSFLVGFMTRISAAILWMMHLIFARGHFTSYGVDLFAHITLFYSIFMPFGDTLSFDSLLKKTKAKSWEARLSLRVLQLHLCIAYMATGIEKVLGEQWRNGDAIWRSLMLPTYQQFDCSLLAFFPHVAWLLGWGTLLIEIGYPFFIFPKRTRLLWVFAVVVLHTGIGVFLGLQLFGVLMALLTFCCFGLSAEKVVSSSDNRARNLRN